MPPVLSVIIPTLNEEKLLGSVLAVYTTELRQRYHVEVIVSDGGSTDATLQMADDHADTVLRHNGTHRQTIAEGRHAGALGAHGDVLVFINGDTVPANPERFFHTLTQFANRSGPYRRASALACPVLVDPAERVVMDTVVHTVFNWYVWLLNALRIGAGRGECQVVRRDVYMAVGGYRVGLAAGEDFDLFGRISRKARVRFAWELLVHESPRRFRKFGYFRILYWWAVNAMSVLLRSRSSSDEWEPVR